ncbi:PREDICTED: afadin- and alpha-actinin-binding protein-like, partial [Gekko japonicus]|uniref:Afadin- and alpha-actinin-binding protein-like n=1 Tax=Gekko japonicus TaxID=146911 RepID=A0ABM1KUC5_GEKJA
MTEESQKFLVDGPRLQSCSEMPADFLASDVAGLSQSPALWRGLPPLSGSLDLLAGLGETGNVFCWRDNLDHCISYLNKELGALGLPTLYKDDGCGTDPERGFNLLALVNGTCGLLRLYHSVSAKLGDLEAEEIRRAGELDHLRARQAKLESTPPPPPDQVETCEREIAAVQAKEQQLESTNKQLKSLLRGEKDEIAKLSNTLAGRAAQHLYEMKRKEQELARLKEKMSQLVTEKKDRRGTIEILNALTRPDGKRPTWKTGKSLGKKEEELYRVQLARQEQREQGLALENARLQQLLAQVGRDVQQLMGADGGLPQGPEQNFPFEVFQEQWCHFRDDLEADLVDSHRTLHQMTLGLDQTEQLDAWVNAELPGHLKGSYFLEEEHRLEEERAIFVEQQQAFEVERRNFTEAAIRLGWEKKQFEEEKALRLKQEFLRSLPRLEVRDPKRRLSAPVAAG